MLKTVDTLGEIRHAVVTANVDDFVIVDCSLNRPEDRDQCERVVRQTPVSVHIVYNPAARDHETFMRSLLRVALGDLTWVPSTVGYLELLNNLRTLRDGALAAHISIQRKPLTAHQERVWGLVAEGRSHKQIADALGNKTGTVKTDISRIKEKLGITSTEELRIAFRWRARSEGAM